jgi:hypothetical protein
VRGVPTAYGSGSTQQLYFFTWQNGNYVVIEGPRYGWSQGAPSGYMFAGEEAKATKIILALPFEGEYLGAHSYQFEIYNWDGAKYIKSEGGITQNKYSWAWWGQDDREFIDQIIRVEPQVIGPAK